MRFALYFAAEYISLRCQMRRAGYHLFLGGWLELAMESSSTSPRPHEHQLIRRVLVPVQVRGPALFFYIWILT